MFSHFHGVPWVHTAPALFAVVFAFLFLKTKWTNLKVVFLLLWLAAPQDKRKEAGRNECQWQHEQLPVKIKELVLDDERIRNHVCWFVFDC